MAQSKRLDLQGIRGIAIISVILFHFLPSIFPNGYIGVDQFFVLSGFLMCMLLRKSSPISIFQLISNFYIRRLKRILPAYFLILLLSILMVFTIFPLTAIDTNVESGKKALIFMSNRVGTDDENYFSMLSLAIDVFTHTWSLSVEVQFYVLVPFLYLIGSKYFFGGKFEIPFYFLIASLSYIYSVAFLSESAAFNSVPARIWQFLIGMIAYLLTDSQDSKIAKHSNKIYHKLEHVELLMEEENEKEDVNIQNQMTSPNGLFLAIILIGAFYPFELPARALRPLITILTGILMISLSKNAKKFLESRFLTYSGDISYSLYLIHWPIYAYWKLELSHGDTWNWRLLIAFGLSVLLAIISYELYEKWYLRQSNNWILIICIILFSLNIGTFYEQDIHDLISPPSPIRHTERLDGLNDTEIVSFEKAEELNKLWSKNDLRYLLIPTCEYGPKVYGQLGPPYGFCRHKGLNNQTGPGKFKIMLIGNSWAASHARLMHQECGPKMHEMVQMAHQGCEPLYNNHTSCTKSVGIMEERVMKEKPDYLFIFSRFMNIGDPLAFHVTKIDDDVILKSMIFQIQKLSESVKYKIFIMQQIASPVVHLLPKIVETIRMKKNLTKFDISLVDRDPEMARLRHEKMVAECPKCELFDYKPQFFNETTRTWRYYDEANHGLEYVTQGFHLSFHGMELVRPVIRDVCKRVL